MYKHMMTSHCIDNISNDPIAVLLSLSLFFSFFRHYDESSGRQGVGRSRRSTRDAWAWAGSNRRRGKQQRCVRLRSTETRVHVCKARVREPPRRRETVGTRESRANPPSRSWIVVGRGSLDEENEKRKWSVNARAVRRAADRASRACYRGLHDCTARTHPIARRALIAKILCTMRAERLPRSNAPPLHCGPIVGSFFQKRFP